MLQVHAVEPTPPPSDEREWVDAYSEALCHCKPSLDPEKAMQAARLEYPFQRLSNPKTAAALDATFGPIAHKARRDDDGGRGIRGATSPNQ